MWLDIYLWLLERSTSAVTTSYSCFSIFLHIKLFFTHIAYTVSLQQSRQNDGSSRNPSYWETLRGKCRFHSRPAFVWGFGLLWKKWFGAEVAENQTINVSFNSRPLRALEAIYRETNFWPALPMLLLLLLLSHYRWLCLFQKPTSVVCIPFLLHPFHSIANAAATFGLFFE